MTGARRERVLITGASAGIGLALARRLATRSNLLLTGRRAEAAVRDALPEGSAYAEADQVWPERAAETIGEAIDRLGWNGLDRAFLNAGTGFAVDPALETADRLRLTLDANVFAAIAVAHRIYPALEAAQGELILIGSMARRGAPGFASYAASKAGLDGFARALAEEWRGRVGVQIIHPGPVATDMHVKAGHDPGRMRRLFLSAEISAELIEKLSRTRRWRSNAFYVAAARLRLGLLR